MSQKHERPCKVLEKPMPQTIDLSSKNDMYIIDPPTAHRLQHKKTTAAQVTTLTQYLKDSQSGPPPTLTKVLTQGSLILQGTSINLFCGTSPPPRCNKW